MFKKYDKQWQEKEISDVTYPGDDLSQRPHSPFSTDLMNSMRVREEEEEPETVIADQVEITGVLKFQKLLRIDGSFEGELQSSGKLIVGPKAVVKANIDLEEAYIAGRVEGNIRVKTRLVLRGRAQVHGNISAPILSVDEGVSIVGELHVAPSAESDQGNF